MIKTHQSDSLLPKELIYLIGFISGRKLSDDNLNRDRILHLIQSHRLIAPVHLHANEFSDPMMKLQVDNLYFINKMEQLKLSAELIRLQLLFDEDKLVFLSFKGPLLSQFLYSDPAERTSLDLDLLIEKPQVEPALCLLQKNGYRVITYYNSPKQLETILKFQHHIVLYHDENGVKVELHWELTSLKSYPFDTSSLLKNAERIELGSVQLLQMNRVDLFNYLCVHGAAHGFFRLQWLIDCYFYFQKLDLSERERLARLSLKEPYGLPVLTTFKLMEVLLGEQANLPLAKHRRVEKLVRVCLQKISRNEEIEAKSTTLEFSWYRMLTDLRIAGLLEGFPGLLRAVVGRNVRPENWKIFAFPDSIFFMNHLFSRFIWLYGKLFAKKAR